MGYYTVSPWFFYVFPHIMPALTGISVNVNAEDIATCQEKSSGRCIPAISEIFDTGRLFSGLRPDASQRKIPVFLEGCAFFFSPVPCSHVLTGH